MYRQLSSSQLNFFRMLDEKIEMVSDINLLYSHFGKKLLLLFSINNI